MRNLLKDTIQNDDGNQPRGNAQSGSVQALDGRADTDVANVKGEITSCDIPFHGGISLERFNADYLRLTREAVRSCINHDVTDSMVIGTSALTKHQIDGAVGMYSGIYNNPFLIWGRYRRGLFRTTLTVSFQFHHTQMDGEHAARFLDEVQHQIDRLR